MTKVIALAGKGGTGKTTISALLIKYLREKQLTPVLAVDADSNANLNELLGLSVELTIGQIRKELKSDLPPNITRDQYMEMKIHQALIEESGFDLLAMGQPDGPGCYCAANQYLAMTMDHLAPNYRYILVDNEAGMEHLSRMNLRVIDHLLVISDPSARGILTARRIAELTGPLGIEIKTALPDRQPGAGSGPAGTAGQNRRGGHRQRPAPGRPAFGQPGTGRPGTLRPLLSGATRRCAGAGPGLCHLRQMAWRE